MMMSPAESDWLQHCLIPDWPAPPQVRALQTTRLGGVSQAPYDSLNVGQHVQDIPEHVQRNRQLLASVLPAQPLWLNQQHSAQVQQADAYDPNAPADAIISQQPHQVCVVMTADCLPVLFCDTAGQQVAAAHAGWRGLAAGVLEATVRQMRAPPDQIMAWLGPCIGPQAFAVGEELRQLFVQQDAQAAQAFTQRDGQLFADLVALARMRLQAIGMRQIDAANLCTHTQAQQFFSYRRDGQCGRMATLIWLDRAAA